MNKEDILAASRQENRDMDIADLELSQKAQRAAGITAVMVAFALIAAEFLLKGEKCYGYLLIVFASNMALWIYRAARQKKKSDILLALLWTAMTIYTAVMYFMNLIG